VTEIDVEPLIQKLSNALAPFFSTDDQPIIVGIETGGYWIAESLHQRLQPETELGKLNITFYRDDFTKIGLHPTVKPSRLPNDVSGKTIILVDDVIYSGRTIRAAMNEIFDYGRPDRIILAALIDRGERELPIQPDIVAMTLALEADEQVKLEGPSPLHLSIQRQNT
jgi:pyrimidine operon attenuation protein/uracil phosphoribosyltransferase